MVVSLPEPSAGGALWMLEQLRTRQLAECRGTNNPPVPLAGLYCQAGAMGTPSRLRDDGGRAFLPARPRLLC